MHKQKGFVHCIYVFLISIFLMVFSSIGNALAADGTISGHVYEADGTTPISGLYVDAQDISTGLHVSVATEANGSYSLALPTGSYKIRAVPSLTGNNYVDEFFDGVYTQDLATVFSVTADQYTSGVDFTLEQGGNISGTITTESPVEDFDDIKVILRELSGKWINYCSVNPDGSYSTNRVIPGDYIVEFEDQNNQFQTEFYDGSAVSWLATPITVTEGNTTPDINVLLKNITNDRYYIEGASIYTFHSYNNTSMTTETRSWSYVSVNRFIDEKQSLRETAKSSLAITKPSGTTVTCTNDSYYVDTDWRIHLNDTNNNGIIEDTERTQPHAQTYTQKECNIGDTPSETGDYIINLTLSDGTTVLSNTLTGVPAGLTSAEFPPVTNLAASWDNTDKELDVSWSLPATQYPDGAFLQIRVQLYNNGQYLHNQIRVQNLPVTLTSFTLDSDTTAYFDTGLVDQIVLDVRIIIDNPHTITRTRKIYSFNSVSGALTEAPITMKLLDVDGDKRTGLAEAIYSLQAVSGN